MSDKPHGGVIHDIGYRRYGGARLGRGYVARSMFVHSLRTAYGFGRSARAKILPVGLLAVAGVAALVIVLISNRQPKPLLSYVGMAGAFSFLAAVFVAVVGPELISRDLRNSVLPLYFSRPVTRVDYALTKLAALATATWLLLAGPMLIMFLGRAFGSPSGIGGVPAETGHFAQGVLSAAIHAVVFTALTVPLAALTGRRVFATGVVIAVFLLTQPITAVLAHGGSGAGLAGLFSPIDLLNGLDDWLFGEGSLLVVGSDGPVYGVVAAVVAAAGIGLTLLRYRKVRI